MRILITILLFITGLAAQGQVTIDSKYYNRSKSSNIWDGVGADSVLFAPKIKATTGKNDGSIMYNRTLRTLELYDSTTRLWYPLASFQLRDGLISGGNVSWTGTGLSFYVGESVYVISGVLYFGNDTTVTLSASDPTDPRLDVIGLNSSGVFVLTGTPAADPAKPQVTPGSELELTSILIAAGATTPSGLTQDVIYDENTEWTVTTSNLTVNADNIVFPYRNSKSIDISSYTSLSERKLMFTRSSVLDMTQYSVLTLYVRLKDDYTNAATINVQFKRISGFLTLSSSSVLTISNTVYNYVRTNDGVYQVIQIPLSDFTFSSSFYPPSIMNRLELTFNDVADGMYLDYVNLQGGIVLPSAGVKSFNGRGGHVIPVKADYAQWFIDTTYRRADSVFGVKNGVEYFQFKDSTGAGSSYTFTNGLTNTSGTVRLGGTLTQNTTIAGAGYSFDINNLSSGTITATSGTEQGQIAITTNNPSLNYTGFTSGRFHNLSADADGWGMTATRTGASTFFNIAPDSIAFRPHLGRIFIDTVEAVGVIDTTLNKALVWNSSTKRMRWMAWPATGSTITPSALTKTDDTNVTLTLGGSPSTSLLAATSLTLGWTGQLSSSRGGSGVNNSGTFTWGSNNITFTTTGTTGLTLPTTGTLSTLAGTETFTNKTLTTPTVTSQKHTVQALTDGATITCDMANGDIATVTLGGNRTLAFSNLQSGQFVVIYVTQDGTGGRTLTLPASTKVINGGGGAVTLTTAANAVDVLTFSYVGSILYCNYGKNYN